MSEKDNGGPAFPVNELHQGTGQFCEQHMGLAVRDYFIAHLGDESESGEYCDYNDHVKALLVGRPCPSGSADGWLAVLQFEADFRAAWRVMRADAMLKAREKS